MPRPHPPEFRQRAVQLAQLREQPIAKITADLGVSESACDAGCAWPKAAAGAPAVAPGQTPLPRSTPANTLS